MTTDLAFINEIPWLSAECALLARGPMVAGFKEGDWLCASCGDHQFARNTSCRKCGAARDVQEPQPAATISGRPIMRVAATTTTMASTRRTKEMAGDWNCPACGDHQFARNATCRRCGEPKPDNVAPGAPPAAVRQDFKEGDWNCAECGDHQFARNATCRRCGAARPGVEREEVTRPSYSEIRKPILAPVTHVTHVAPTPVPTERGFMAGDWNCPACGDHQFARNASCRRCGAERPALEAVPILRGAQVIEIDGQQYIPAPIVQPTRAIPSVTAPRTSNGQDFKAGDWKCPACGDHQFERNVVCRRCGEPKPTSPTLQTGSIRDAAAAFRLVNADIQERPARPSTRQNFKPGDWTCPGCGDHQFGRNEQCRKCGTDRPETPEVTLSSNHQAMKPGDWYCPACGDMQFARNQHCRKCGCDRPDESRSRSPRR